MEDFWAPLLHGSGAVLVSVNPARHNGQAVPHLVTVNATIAVSRVVAVLQQYGKAHEVRPFDEVDFSDWKRQPFIAVGGYNEWTAKVNRGLRFRFGDPLPGGSPMHNRILDLQRPQSVWLGTVSASEGKPAAGDDFALVTRMTGTHSGHYVLALGGLGHHGTAAAAEFVTTPALLEKFAVTAPPGWESKNLQLVIATTVVDGVAGPPRVVAVHCWD
jgi:hypothetical protein